MAVKILIRRHVPIDKVKDVAPLVKRLRVLATNQEGYISGLTLERIDSPGVYLVISTWQSVEKWNSWLAANERHEIQSMIDSILKEKTEFEVYKYS